MMKILLIITSWDFGGAEVQVHLLAQKYKKLGHTVKIISMISCDTAFKDDHSVLGVEVISLNMKKGKPSIKALFELKNRINSYKPDVVHAHMIHAVIMARVVRLLTEIPKLISTAHSINENINTENNIEKSTTLRDLMYRLTDFLSDANTNVSQIGTDLYVQKKIFSKEKTFFVPNGITTGSQKAININLHDIFNIPVDNFIFLAVGRLEPPKDYYNLIKAVEILIQKKSRFCVLIAGEGSLHHEIENKIQKKQLSTHVKLIGRRGDVLSLLQAADSFVMSSAWEGLPIALLEALSVGLPAIVTDVGGCKEAVKDYINGYVVPPKNAEALAEKMFEMINMEKLIYCNMKNNAISFIEENYDIDVVVDKWLSLYQNSSI